MFNNSAKWLLVQKYRPDQKNERTDDLVHNNIRRNVFERLKILCLFTGRYQIQKITHPTADMINHFLTRTTKSNDFLWCKYITHDSTTVKHLLVKSPNIDTTNCAYCIHVTSVLYLNIIIPMQTRTYKVCENTLKTFCSNGSDINWSHLKQPLTCYI
jgi:hypothetical protein